MSKFEKNWKPKPVLWRLREEDEGDRQRSTASEAPNPKGTGQLTVRFTA